jgi:hypothetical protein
MPSLKSGLKALLAIFGTEQFVADPQGTYFSEEQMTKMNDATQAKDDSISALTNEKTRLESELQTAKADLKTATDANKVAVDATKTAQAAQKKAEDDLIAANTEIDGLTAKLSGKPVDGKKPASTGAEGKGKDTDGDDQYAYTNKRVAENTKARAGIKNQA